MRALKFLVALTVAMSPMQMLLAADGPHTPQEFAAKYIGAFNKQDREALKKLRYPLSARSDMQDMVDSITDGELSEKVQYSKFELTNVDPEMMKPQMGPDGKFYQPNLKATNMLKLTSVSANGSTSTTFPIGQKDGVYYQIGIEPAGGAPVDYKFGWQRFTAPQAGWSVMMPNEPEPGRAAIEKAGGKDALKDPDAYGVVKNTADIKTTQHFFRCAEEGKRVHAPDSKEMYSAACTTYAPETLKEWFGNVNKNIDDTVQGRVMEYDGKLVKEDDIKLGDAPGKQFEITAKDGRLCIGRVYWIKDALYELKFESQKEKPDRAEAMKFLESLKID